MIGIVAMIGIQTLINLGVVVGLFPVTGVTLQIRYFLKGFDGIIRKLSKSTIERDLFDNHEDNKNRKCIQGFIENILRIRKITKKMCECTCA